MRTCIQVLATIGEVEAGHPARRTLTHQVQIREILGQPAADRHEYPIEVAVFLDLGTFVREIPDVLSPGLQLDESKIRPCSDVNLDDPGVHGFTTRLGRRGRFMHIGYGSAVFHPHDHVREVRQSRPRPPQYAVQGLFELQAAGYR